MVNEKSIIINNRDTDTNKLGISLQYVPSVNAIVVSATDDPDRRGVITIPSCKKNITIWDILINMSEPIHMPTLTAYNLHKTLDVIEDMISKASNDTDLMHLFDDVWCVLNYVWKWRTTFRYVKKPYKTSTAIKRAIYMMKIAEKPLPYLGPRNLIDVGWRAVALLKLIKHKAKTMNVNIDY